jgi:hypothetical protein
MKRPSCTYVRFTAALTIAAVVTLGACVSSSKVGAGATEVQPTPSSVANALTPSPSGAPISAVELPVPSVDKPANRNARSTPTSRLFWAQRETVLLVINAMMSSDTNGVVTSTLIPTLDTVDAEILGLQGGKVDPALGPFLERFTADLAAARSAWTSKPLLSSQDIVHSFDFENYPAVKEFAAAAKRDPGCVDVA